MPASMTAYWKCVFLFLHRREFPQRNSTGKAGTLKMFNRMNQGMFLKFAGLSKFCYKEMELPIEKIL